MLAYVRIPLARALLRSGKTEEAMVMVDSALSFTQALDLGSFLQGALEINAEILAHKNTKDVARIDQMMEQAATMVERGRSSWHKILHLMTWARIRLKLGNLELAREDLAQARDLYRDTSVKKGTRELWAIEKALKAAEMVRRK